MRTRPEVSGLAFRVGHLCAPSIQTGARLTSQVNHDTWYSNAEFTTYGQNGDRVRLRDPPSALISGLAREINCPQGETPLEWMILTSEPVSTERAAKTVVRYYESRWLIEEFHKAWKTGCRIQERPVQAVRRDGVSFSTWHRSIQFPYIEIVRTHQASEQCS